MQMIYIKGKRIKSLYPLSVVLGVIGLRDRQTSLRNDTAIPNDALKEEEGGKKRWPLSLSLISQN